MTVSPFTPDGPARRFTAPAGGLPAALRAAYAEDGFLILEGFAEPWRCDLLRERAAELIAGCDPARPATIFSTRDQSHARSAEFRASGSGIAFFFEEDAFDAAGRLVRPAPLAINKIGHALHAFDPVFAAFSREPRLAAIAAALGLETPLLVQSMYLCKQPLIGAEVGWHQDAAYLHTDPPSATGFWIALEDATLANGCMLALAGAHRGALRQRLRDRGGELILETLDPAPWPDRPVLALEAPKGSLVLLHGLLPHASGPNRSARSRHAYALHVIDGAARYSSDNWLQPAPGRPFRGFR
ncbi:MAG: phytanoyl-CoA dioxygenase family protein [Alphaproteobacteria bacterium]|nr:phytanoyl-CoA dioxygenase family protein [Alphaproteobacteria bacterium]